MVEDIVDIRRDGIGQNDLHDKAHDDEFQSVGHILIACWLQRLELRQQTARAFNRAGEKLHEKQHIEQEINDIALCPLLFPIHIGQITECLESVKRHAQREDERVVAGPFGSVAGTEPGEHEHRYG